MHRICPLLVALMMLTACSKNEVAVSTQAARQEFLQTVELVQLVQLTHAPTKDREARLKAMNSFASFGDDATIAAIAKAKDYEGFRDAVLDAARKKLKGLLTKGVTSQRVAAHHLLAQIETLHSSSLRRNAIQTSDTLASEIVTLVDSTRNIDQAKRMAATYDSDDAAIVAKLQQHKSEVATESTKLGQAVTALKGEVADLKSQLASFEKARDAAFAKSSNLNGQAFTKKEQERYDLEIAAIAADREGYAAEEGVRKTKVELDLAEARLAIAEHDLKMYEDWSKGITAALGDSGTRKATLASVQSNMSSQIEKSIRDRIMPAFRTITKSYQDSIEKPIDEAIASASEAVKLATAAESLAAQMQESPDLKNDSKIHPRLEAKMWTMDANVEKLQALVDGMITTSTLGSTIRNVLKNGEQVLGGDAAELKTLLASLATKNASYYTEAATAISAVKAAYGDPLIAGVSGDGDLATARAARIKTVKELIAILERSGTLTAHQLAAAAE